ncbi:MAG: DNA N-6-adenine-methyltransferase [Bacteroidota bacterium]
MGAYEAAGKSNEWFTPKYVFDAMQVRFDLDVAHPEQRTYVPCDEYYTSGSLEKEWKGFVWMNPPFGNQRTKELWIRKFIKHANGVTLLPDRTSAPWWHEFTEAAEYILFFKGKPKFIRPDGTIGNQPGNGACLFGIGPKALQALTNAHINGLGLLTQKMIN